VIPHHRNNVGAYCLARDGRRVLVTHHDADRDFPGKDTYDLYDVDTGETTQEMGYATWFEREIERPVATRYSFQLWTGVHWSTVRRIDGIGEAFRYARHWTERGFDVRVACGSVVIDHLWGSAVKVA
jgi:hypothetical protein